MRSDDGGKTWTPAIVANPVVSTDKHHVLPSLAIDTDPNDVQISYYTQHTDERSISTWPTRTTAATRFR